MAVKTILTKQQILQGVRDHADKIKKFYVLRLGLFGSFVRGNQQYDSDIDFLVEFQQGQKTYDNFIELAFLLEDIFQKKVALLTRRSLSNRIKESIDKEIEYVSFNS